MKQRRVVITGLGVVSAIGNNIPEFAGALKNGACGIGPVTAFDVADYRTHTAGEVWNFNPRSAIPRPFWRKRMSRSDALAMTAALEALTEAGLLPVPDALKPDMGVIMGGGAGGMLECEPLYRDYLKENQRPAFSPFASFCCASSADMIASTLELMGPKTTFMTACSSGAAAIGFARDLIANGMAQAVVAGGTEPLSRITYAVFNGLQAVDPDYPKPFDKNRKGMSLAEGAGVLILESLDHAKCRGARIIGEALGYGMSCDAWHTTAPDPSAAGAIRSMIAALEDAGIDPSHIDYINAHGTATPANDSMETTAIKTVFGNRAFDIPVSSTKSMHGHTLGAAGAIEAVVCALAIRDQFIPPTIHHVEPAPDCDLDYVADGARNADIGVALSNSFAFGGNNVTIVLGRFAEKGVA